MATVRLQLRRGTASQWTSANPILAAGEMGVETDTRKVKVGDGTTLWNSLDYVAADAPAIGEIAQDAINDALVAGTGITKSYNDGANTITVSVDTSIIATKAELAEVAQDSVNDSLVAGVGLNKTYDDVNNLITIDIDSTVATLTGTQTLTNKTLTSPVINTPTGIVKSDVGLGNVDNTSDANKPVSTAAQAALDLKADLASPTFTGTVSGITKSMVGLGNVDNTSDANKPVSTAAQAALDLKANLLSPSLTGTPTAPTANAGTNNTQIATTAYVETAVANLIASAPETLNTLNELAEALAGDANFSNTITTSIGTKVSKAGDTMTGPLVLNADPLNAMHAATKQYVDSVASSGLSAMENSLEGHRLTTTNVHGIADTANLVTTSSLSSTLENYATEFSVTTSINSINSDIEGINSALGIHGSDITALQGDVGTNSADIDQIETDLSNHQSATTNVHGISNTANLVYSVDLTNQISGANGYTDSSISTHNSDTTNVHGIADTSVLVTSSTLNSHTSAATNVHGIADTADLVTINGSQELQNKRITSPKINENVDLTATSTELNVLDGITASTAELNYVDGVTSSIQAQLDSKAPIASPTFTGTVSGITKSMVGLGNVDNTSDANKPVSTAAQAALDLKADLASPTFTGTVSGITKSMVGLGNVDNTSDANKPVSTATQTQLDTKLSLAGGIMTGGLTLSGNPTLGLHAATKEYVDAAVEGLHVHASAVAATTANINLSTDLENGDILDGVTLATGDRVLVKNQSTASQNGIYVVQASGAAVRAADFDSPGEIDGGDFIFVTGGTVNDNTGWVQTSLVGTIGTDPISFTQFSGAGTYLAGSALTLTGNTFSIEDGAITSAKIANGTIDTVDIADNAISTAKVADGAITSAKIADGAVVTADLADEAVTSAKIANGTIVDADINATADIAQSKIANLTTDLAAKAPIASPTFTGTVSGITKSMVGLGNVDNTSDANKPVSTAAQAALDLKANLASPTFTGTVTVASNGIAFTDRTQTKAGVPSLTTIASTVSSNTTLDALGTDANVRDSLIPLSGSVNVSFESTGNAKYAIGSSISFYQSSGTGANITGNGINILSTPGSILRTTNSSVTATKVAATSWLLAGDLRA